jgi:hypothetical protein
MRPVVHSAEADEDRADVPALEAARAQLPRDGRAVPREPGERRRRGDIEQRLAQRHRLGRRVVAEAVEDVRRGPGR